MTVLAVTRPTDWDFPLFLHILGATILVGGLVTAVGMQSLAWRKREPDDVRAFGRWGFWALLTVALPGWVLMRVGAQWIYSKEGWSGEGDPSWLGIGFTVGDIGLPVLVIAIILAGLGVRQLRKAGTNVFGRLATPLAIVLLVAYLVAVWAMTAKPD
jgi:uncharacterized integral membrane protein